jgi:hypothetical protein
MNFTVPASRPRCACKSFTAPASIAVCESCPHACIRPGSFDLKGRSVSSGIGSASMSPRKSTVRPCVGPCSVTTIPDDEGPVSIFTSSPSSASRTAATVFGKNNPSSGCS